MGLADFLNNRRRKKSGATRGSLKRSEFKKLSNTAGGRRMQGGSGQKIRKARKALSEAGAVTEEQAAKKAAKAEKQSKRLVSAQERSKKGGRTGQGAKKQVKRLNAAGVTTEKQKKKNKFKITTWRDLE